MKANPIFFRLNFQEKKIIQITREEVSHLKSLRLYNIDKNIEIRDGLGGSYIFHIPHNSNQGELIETYKNEFNETKIQIATAIPKSGKFEFLLQKSTEIGVSDFHFINFSHSERKDFNLERANKILMESASQCKRHTIPTINLYKNLKEFLNQNLPVFCLMPKAEDSIQNFKPNSSIIPIIGPEGGYSQEEVELIRQRKIPTINLVKNILRIETACIFIISIIRYNSIG